MVKILSYNTHLFGPTVPGEFGQYYKDDERKEAICNHVKVVDPDVVCLCEVWSEDYKQDIIKALKYQYNYSSYDNTPSTEIGNGLLMLSKYPIYNDWFVGYENLSGADELSQKGILYASIYLNIGQQFRIFFTHTQADPDPEHKRAKNIDLISDVYEEYHSGIPAIALGDFNIYSGNDEYLGMMRTLDDFKDSVLGNTIPTTYDKENNILAKRFGGKDDKSGKLDYILTTEDHWNIKSFSVIRDFNIEGIDCSDHYPILATLKLEESSKIPIAFVYDTYENALKSVREMKTGYGNGVSTLIILQNDTEETWSFGGSYSWNGNFYHSPPPVIHAKKFAAILHHHPDGHGIGSEAQFVYSNGKEDGCFAFSAPWAFWFKNKVHLDGGKSDITWAEETIYKKLNKDGDYNNDASEGIYTFTGTIETGTSPLAFFKISTENAGDVVDFSNHGDEL